MKDFCLHCLALSSPSDTTVKKAGRQASKLNWSGDWARYPFPAWCPREGWYYHSQIFKQVGWES